MLALSELNAIKERAKMPVITQKTENDHIRQWAERVKKQRDQRQKEKRAKFELAELEKRQIDIKEAELQQHLKNQLIINSNKQIFENSNNVRRFQSTRLFCETQNENEKLQQIKKAYEEFKATQDQYLVERAQDTVSKRYFQDVQQQIEQKEKVKQNKLEVLAQADEQKQGYIKRYLDDKVQGQVIMQKVNEDLNLMELQKQQRLQRNMNYVHELQNQIQKIKQKEKEIQERERNEDQLRKEEEMKKNTILTIRKKRVIIKVK